MEVFFLFLFYCSRVKKNCTGSRGAEHKPGRNENVVFAVKQHTETASGHGIHPNYVSILDVESQI